MSVNILLVALRQLSSPHELTAFGLLLGLA
jgi:hypothetical protein